MAGRITEREVYTAAEGFAARQEKPVTFVESRQWIFTRWVAGMINDEFPGEVNFFGFGKIDGNIEFELHHKDPTEFMIKPPEPEADRPFDSLFTVFLNAAVSVDVGLEKLIPDNKSRVDFVKKALVLPFRTHLENQRRDRAKSAKGR